MRTFLILLSSLALCMAEAPVFSTQAAVLQPYRPRGFRPSPAFNLPLRAYGAPAPSYGPPPQEPTTTLSPTTTEASTEEATTEPQVLNVRFPHRSMQPFSIAPRLYPKIRFVSSFKPFPEREFCGGIPKSFSKERKVV